MIRYHLCLKHIFSGQAKGRYLEIVKNIFIFSSVIKEKETENASEFDGAAQIRWSCTNSVSSSERAIDVYEFHLIFLMIEFLPLYY